MALCPGIGRTPLFPQERPSPARCWIFPRAPEETTMGANGGQRRAPRPAPDQPGAPPQPVEPAVRRRRDRERLHLLPGSPAVVGPQPRAHAEQSRVRRVARLVDTYG